MQNYFGKKIMVYVEKVEENGAFLLALPRNVSQVAFFGETSALAPPSQGSRDVVRRAAASRPPRLCSPE